MSDPIDLKRKTYAKDQATRIRFYIDAARQAYEDLQLYRHNLQVEVPEITDEAFDQIASGRIAVEVLETAEEASVE